MSDFTRNPHVRELWLSRGYDDDDHVRLAGKAVASLVARGQWSRQVERMMIELCDAVHHDPSVHNWQDLIPRFADGSLGY